MSKATQDQLAVEVAPGEYYWKTCQQTEPGRGRCATPASHRCDACGKLVCRAHMRPVGGKPGESPIDLCHTCVALAEWAGCDARDVSRERRADFYREGAAGFIGPHELDFLKSLG